MKKYMYVALIVMYIPFLFFAQSDAQRLFVWDNDRGKSDQDHAAVGFFDDTRGFAAWDDGRWGDYDVFGQEYILERGLVGSNFNVSIDQYNRFIQWHTDISCNPKNMFVTVWEDSQYNPGMRTPDLYHLVCGKEPYCFWKSSDQSGKFPSVSSKKDGFFAVSWTIWYEPEYPSIHCMLFRETGEPFDEHAVCPAVQIMDFVPLSNVAYNDSGGIVVYEDWRNDGTDYSIFGQYFKPDGGIIDDFKVSHWDGYTGDKYERDPDVAINEDGDVIVVWVDNCDDPVKTKIWAQKMIAKQGGCSFDGHSFVLWPEGQVQRNPRAAVSKDGDFIITWEEDRGEGWDVWYIVLPRGGNPKQPDSIPVINSGDQFNPYVSCRWGTNVGFVWTSLAFHPKHGDVFLRLFTIDNSTTGLNPQTGDIPLVPMNPDTSVGGRKCWYFDDENYDNPATTDWNEDPIPEGSPQYVDLEYAIVDQLTELNTNNQYIIECEDTLPFRQGKALTDYDGIFLDLGYRTLFSSAGTITQDERNALSNYVDTSTVVSGGPLMVDGNDFGYMYDTTALFKHFYAEYRGDGAAYTTGNIDTLLGKTPGVFSEGMELPYCYQDLPDNYPDSIRPLERGGRLLLETTSLTEWYAGYSIGSCMSWFDAGREQYNTIYNSFIPSAVTGTIHPNTYSEYYRRCLGHMDLAVQPEPIVDLTTDTLGLKEGEVELCWTIVCDDKIDDPVNDGYQLKFSRTKMTSETEYNAAEEYYQNWTTPGAVDDTAWQTLSGLPPMDTLIFALKCHDEDNLYNALGAEPRMRVKGDSITPHNIMIGTNYVRDFSRRYEFLHRYPHLTGNDSLFVSWDADSFYIGLAGQSFNGNGDLLIYFDIVNGSGADSTYPYNSTTSGCTRFYATGEFRPEYCIIFETHDSCCLFECTGKDGRDSWSKVTFHGKSCEDNVLNNYLYTEISIPFTDFSGYSISNQFEMVATIQNESNNQLTHVYPPYNHIPSGLITMYYRWSRLEDDMVPKYTAGIIGIQEQESAPDPGIFGKVILAVPNPFNATVDLYFNASVLSQSAHLRIFDVTGRLVRDFDLSYVLPSSVPRITWDGTDDRGLQVARGIYFCELATAQNTVIEKIIYIR